MQLFNIPQQPLGAALVAYSNIVGNQIIYDSRLIGRRSSAPVVGLYTPDTALRLMIEGSGLTIRYTSPRDVTLVALGEGPASASAGAQTQPGGAPAALALDTLYVELPAGARTRPDFTAYGQAVRLEIKRALAESTETAYRTLSVQVEFWIDPKGHVRRLRLLKSSGGANLDAVIERVLGAVAFKEPPSRDMPQPIRVTILGI